MGFSLARPGLLAGLNALTGTIGMMPQEGRQWSLQAESCDQEHRVQSIYLTRAYPILFYPILSYPPIYPAFKIFDKNENISTVIVHQQTWRADSKMSMIVIDALTEHAES